MQLFKIYSIIDIVALTKKGVWNYILNKKVRNCTKDILKLAKIMIAAFIIILAITLIKYKPLYKVTISGKEIKWRNTKSWWNKYCLCRYRG